MLKPTNIYLLGKRVESWALFSPYLHQVYTVATFIDFSGVTSDQLWHQKLQSLASLRVLSENRIEDLASLLINQCGSELMQFIFLYLAGL